MYNSMATAKEMAGHLSIMIIFPSHASPWRMSFWQNFQEPRACRFTGITCSCIEFSIFISVFMSYFWLPRFHLFTRKKEKKSSTCDSAWYFCSVICVSLWHHWPSCVTYKFLRTNISIWMSLHILLYFVKAMNKPIKIPYRTLVKQIEIHVSQSRKYYNWQSYSWSY